MGLLPFVILQNTTWKLWNILAARLPFPNQFALHRAPAQHRMLTHLLEAERNDEEEQKNDRNDIRRCFKQGCSTTLTHPVSKQTQYVRMTSTTVGCKQKPQEAGFDAAGNSCCVQIQLIQNIYHYASKKKIRLCAPRWLDTRVSVSAQIDKRIGRREFATR